MTVGLLSSPALGSKEQKSPSRGFFWTHLWLSMILASFSSIILVLDTSTSPVSASTTSPTRKRPRTRSENFSMTCPFSLISETLMPWVTWQSSSRMMTSWETSTIRRVR